FPNNPFDVPGPGSSFIIEDSQFFGANSTFLNAAQNIGTTDSLNTKFYAFRLYYELTKFHKEENNKNALFSVELDRVKFIKNNSNLENEDELYYSALQRLANAYQNDAFSSEAWYEIALVHSNKGSTYNFLADTSGRWEYNVALDICEKTVKKFPNVYGSRQCEALKHSIMLKNLSLTGEQAVPVNEESRFRLDYRNVNKFYYKIVPYDYTKLQNGKHDWNKMLEYLRKTTGVFSKNLDLRDPGDHQNHSTEIVIPKLENGFYYVVVSSHPEFKESGEAFSIMPLWSTDLTYQMRYEYGDQNVLVTNRKTGEPIAGAKATVTYQKYNPLISRYEYKLLGKYTTDENGRFMFSP